MIDSHCHLTYPQLFDQLASVLDRAREAGVTGMITIGTTLPDARRAIELCRKHSHIRCAVGVHPHHAAEASAEDLAQLAVLEKEHVVLALGEMGLDYHYDFCPRDIQRRVFLTQLELAQKCRRPIVIHGREAIDDILAILRDFPTLAADFHCFTGTILEARSILDAGYTIGLTGVVTYTRSEDLRKIAAFIPDDRLLVETDAPYLSPEPVRKQRTNHPANVMHTAAAIAAVRNISIERLDAITTANVRKLFNWN